MPQTVTIPGVGDVDFPDSMSQDDISTAAKRLHDTAPPFDVNKQNATMRANMAKQDEGRPVLAYGGDYATWSKTHDLNNRPDSNIIGFGNGGGIAPEDVLTGGLTARGIVRATKGSTGFIGKMAAGAGSAVSQESSNLAYEIARNGLIAIGMPPPLATILAFGVSGRGGKPKAGVTAGVPPTVTEQLGLAEQPLGATMPQTHAPLSRPQPLHMGGPSLRGPEPVVDRSGPAALFKERPLFQQQQAMEQHGSQPAAAPVVSPTPVFPQAGGRGDITAPESPEARRMLEEALKKRTTKTAIALESPQAAAARLGAPPSAPNESLPPELGINAYAGPERRIATSATDRIGIERRAASNALPSTGSIAERAAALRKENPNIDADAAAMRARANTASRAPVGKGNKAVTAEQYAQSLMRGETTPEQVSKVLEHERGRRMSVVDRAVFLKAIMARAAELTGGQ